MTILDDKGCKKLARHLILLAGENAQKGNKNDAQWLFSRDAETWADAAGIDRGEMIRVAAKALVSHGFVLVVGHSYDT